MTSRRPGAKRAPPSSCTESLSEYLRQESQVRLPLMHPRRRAHTVPCRARRGAAGPQTPRAARRPSSHRPEGALRSQPPRREGLRRGRDSCRLLAGSSKGAMVGSPSSGTPVQHKAGFRARALRYEWHCHWVLQICTTCGPWTLLREPARRYWAMIAVLRSPAHTRAWMGESVSETVVDRFTQDCG